MIAPGETDHLRFQSLVGRELGLWFDDHRRAVLADALRERAALAGFADASAYLDSLAHPSAAREWQELGRRLTVTETFFLRGLEHFRVVFDSLLPALAAEPSPPRPVRLLSAGCASGEEPYSLALLLAEQPEVLRGRAVEIVGVDVNGEALEKARSGRYSTWSLRETPARLRERYFQTNRHGELVLDERIRSMVTFQERNLARPNEDLWQPAAFDVVFCRNMLMYFAPEAAAALVGRIEHALTDRGTLFMGHAETLRGLSHAFQLRRSQGAFFYERRHGESTDPQEPALAAASASTAAPTWLDAIGRATTKIATLAGAGARPEPFANGESPAATASNGRDYGFVLDLHRQERFADALTHLQQLPVDAAADADMQILQAVLLVHCGRTADAEALCRPVLGRDDLNAGAHHVAALCREHAGDLAASEGHDAAAAYLDPTFAMPRFHLGLICRRLGRRSEALVHFEAALMLLAKEDPARLLLFGGGFSREVLMQACRSEIRRLRGST